jgi:hypothetical protein
VEEMASFEELPYELIEALRSKNLLPFLELQETSCNQLTIVVYENQKFRPIIGEWGGIVGIHLIPGIDRRPFTNERGDQQLIVPFEEIDPINGFKWESEWKIDIGETTDADGFEYAVNWTMLHRDRGCKPRRSPLTYVRRRKWKRVMVVDLNLMSRNLPYELRATVIVKPIANGQSINWSSAYIEIFVNGVIQGSGMVSPPGWSKEFTLPFAYIDRSKELTVVFSRTGIVQSAFGQKTVTKVKLGEIVHQSNPQAVLARTILHEDKSVVAVVEWKIVENPLFRIYNLEESLSVGQLKDMVLTEEKLSQRLKQKIIMLSLGLGSNCNGLIKEITNILTEGHPIVSDLDLMEILDDVNSVQGRNEFEKVIALLKDAEKGSRIRAVSYPPSIPWFTTYLNMHVYDLWKNYRPDRVRMQEIINAYYYAEAWYHNQPNCLIQRRVQYEDRFCRRINGEAIGGKTASPTKKATKVTYSVHLHMRGEIKEILLEVFDLSTYIALLRLLSLVKYFQSGVYNKQTIIDLQYPTIVVLLGGIFGGIHAEARADFQGECFDLEYMDLPSESDLIFDQILPIRIPFEYIESVVLSHDHYLAYDSVLEIKLLGATSFTSSGSTNYKFRLEMNSLGGQTHFHDFSLAQDAEGRQPPSGTLNDSFHLFVSSHSLNLKYDDSKDTTKEIVDQSTLDTSMDQQEQEQSAHINICVRLGTVVPQMIASSPKKTSSKRDSFFSMSSSSNNITIDSGKGAPPSLIAQLPPVFLASNNDYTSLGHANIGLDIGMNQEKEMQIRLEKKNFMINFLLSSVQLVHSESIGDRDVYGLVYVADMYGQPFSIGNNSDSSNAKSSKVAGSMYDASYLRRTSRINAQGNFVWKDGERLSLDSNYYPNIENAAYFLVELFAASKDGVSDKLLGECLVPVVYEELMDSEGDSIEFRPPTVNAIRCSVPAAAMEFHHELAGDLMASTTYCLLTDKSALSPQSTQIGGTAPMGRASNRVRARGNVVKVLAGLKAIHPVDCAWPGHFLINGKNTLDATRCHVEILQEGLIIHADNPAVVGSSNLQSPFLVNDAGAQNASNSFAWTILQDCMERKSCSSENVEVLIAYDHIQMEDVCALSNHMLYLAFKVRRKLVSTQSQKVGYREVRLELIVGPCLAEEMSAVICNRIVMFPMRNFLCQHISSTDRNQEEAFTRLVKMFQESIYETISLIEHASSPSRRKKLRNQNGIENDENNPENDDEDELSDENSIEMINRLTYGSGASDLEHGELSKTALEEKALLHEQWKNLFPSSEDSSSLKLLYLKLATLKLYLWYLIEQSPLEFSAERHYLDSSWILFDEMGSEGSSHQEDLDTLIFRINGIMRNLEQEVRCQILRACRKNTGDISSILTKIIYNKYLQVITMLHEAIDYTVKAPSNPMDSGVAGTVSAGRTAGSFSTNSNTLSHTPSRIDSEFDDVFRGSSVVARPSGKAADTMYVAVNPQKKRDLIKFVIVNDDIFENFLNSILRSHRYKFSLRPLLSLCIQFEDLIDEFGKILDENILMWNTRTLRHFMSSRDDQHAIANSSAVTTTTSASNNSKSTQDGSASDSSLTLPWDITTILQKAQNRELFISSIPETIQIQLNVEIGLKKVIPNAKFMSQHSTESLMRIDKMNIKIAQAIARSYIALASEYEKVMFNMIGQYAPWVIMPGATQEKDDIMCFIASIVNDCERISGTHIPQSIELFTQEYGFDPDFHDATDTSLGGNVFNRRGNGHMRTSLLGMLEESNVNDPNQIPSISFSTCLKAISVVSRSALNELTNQVLFSFDVKEYFLTGIDNRKIIAPPAKSNAASKGDSNASVSRWRRNNKDDASGKSSVEVNKAAAAVSAAAKAENDQDAEHSPLDILLATMTAFLVFACKHLNTADTERLYYLCCQKIIIRYLIVMRDYHTMLETKSRRFWGRGNKQSTSGQPAKSPNSRRSLSTRTNDEEDSEVVSTLDREIEENAMKGSDLASSSQEDDNESVTTTTNTSATTTSRHPYPHANSHNKSKNPDFEKMKHDVREITRFYSRMKTRLVPHWDEDVRQRTEKAMSLNQQRKAQLREQQAQQRRKSGYKKNYDEEGDVYEEVEHDEEDEDDDNNKLNEEDDNDEDDNEEDLGAGEDGNEVVDVDAEKKRRRKKTAKSAAGNHVNNPMALIEENPFDRTLSELLKKLSQCLLFTLSHDWAGNHVVDSFLSLNFGMDPPCFQPDINKYDLVLEKFFRHDPAFAQFIPMLDIVQDEFVKEEFGDNRESAATGPQAPLPLQKRPSFFARARTSFSRLSISSKPGIGDPSVANYIPLYVVQLTNLACFRVKKFQNLFMKIHFNGKILLTNLRTNTSGTPQWDDIISFPAIPLSQCKDIKIELYGFRLRALKMRRQIYVGSVQISVVDVLRSEIAHQQQTQLLHQQQQKQQHLGMGSWLMKSPLGSFSQLQNNKNGNNKQQQQQQRGSDISRLSFSSLHRGIQAMSTGNNATSSGGCTHTAWYTLVTKAGLLSSLATNSNHSSNSNEANGAHPSAHRANKASGKQITQGNTKNVKTSLATTSFSSSYVAALSSRGPREDVDSPQIRLTLIVRPHHKQSELSF